MSNTPQPNTSISHGTMRPQDIIPAFLDALEAYNPAAHEQISIAPSPFIPGDAVDDDDHEWWDSDDCRYKLEDLFDALDECSPEGCYFGAHPGDGSDYGFWEIED